MTSSDDSGASVFCNNAARQQSFSNTFMHNVEFRDFLCNSDYSTTQGMTSQRKSRFMLLTRGSIFHYGVWVKLRSFCLCSGESLWSREASHIWNIHSPTGVWLWFPLRCELNMCVTKERERQKQSDRQTLGFHLIVNWNFWNSTERKCELILSI